MATVLRINYGLNLHVRQPLSTTILKPKYSFQVTIQQTGTIQANTLNIYLFYWIVSFYKVAWFICLICDFSFLLKWLKLSYKYVFIEVNYISLGVVLYIRVSWKGVCSTGVGGVDFLIIHGVYGWVFNALTLISSKSI